MSLRVGSFQPERNWSRLKSTFVRVVWRGILSLALCLPKRHLFADRVAASLSRRVHSRCSSSNSVFLSHLLGTRPLPVCSS